MYSFLWILWRASECQFGCVIDQPGNRSFWSSEGVVLNYSIALQLCSWLIWRTFLYNYIELILIGHKGDLWNILQIFLRTFPTQASCLVPVRCFNRQLSTVGDNELARKFEHLSQIYIWFLLKYLRSFAGFTNQWFHKALFVPMLCLETLRWIMILV